MIDPTQCETMADVRAGVDALDQRIAALLSERFRFMDAAARIKADRSEVRDEARKTAVVEQARSWAVGLGAPPNLIARIYDVLVEASIEYELAAFDAQRQP